MEVLLLSSAAPTRYFCSTSNFLGLSSFICGLQASAKYGYC
jgi:hypothetical protein